MDPKTYAGVPTDNSHAHWSIAAMFMMLCIRSPRLARAASPKRKSSLTLLQAETSPLDLMALMKKCIMIKYGF